MTAHAVRILGQLDANEIVDLIFRDHTGRSSPRSAGGSSPTPTSSCRRSPRRWSGGQRRSTPTSVQVGLSRWLGAREELPAANVARYHTLWSPVPGERNVQEGPRGAQHVPAVAGQARSRSVDGLYNCSQAAAALRAAVIGSHPRGRPSREQVDRLSQQEGHRPRSRCTTGVREPLPRGRSRAGAIPRQRRKAADRGRAVHAEPDVKDRVLTAYADDPAEGRGRRPGRLVLARRRKGPSAPAIAMRPGNRRSESADGSWRTSAVR